MSYEEMVAELRNLVGERIAVSMALQQFGPADGYLADFSGRVEPIDDPIPGVDFPFTMSGSASAVSVFPEPCSTARSG
jgi:hypothetical protein